MAELTIPQIERIAESGPPWDSDDVDGLCSTALSAIRERERLKNLLAIALHEQDAWIKTAHLKVNELIEVRADRDALRAAIKDALCDRGCWGGTIAAGGTDEKPNRHPHLPKCWKSRIGVANG